METIQMSVERQMDKQNFVYPHNGILSPHKGGHSDTCFSVDET